MDKKSSNVKGIPVPLTPQQIKKEKQRITQLNHQMLYNITKEKETKKENLTNYIKKANK